MASRTNTVTASSKRFELPALDLNIGRITDGTSIPPPPASPVKRVPTPPRTPSPVKAPTSNGAVPTNLTLSPVTGVAGVKRPADDAPLSPAASTRPGSLRRLFSRNKLNEAFVEDGQQLQFSQAVPPSSESRPQSRGGMSFMGDKKFRRGSGWFRRLRSGSDSQSRRSSVMTFEDLASAAAAKKPSGPPPPMIPELTELEKDEGSLGNDLFSNIR